jgi:hypothetical protein
MLNQAQLKLKLSELVGEKPIKKRARQKVV